MRCPQPRREQCRLIWPRWCRRRLFSKTLLATRKSDTDSSVLDNPLKRRPLNSNHRCRPGCISDCTVFVARSHPSILSLTGSRLVARGVGTVHWMAGWMPSRGMNLPELSIVIKRSARLAGSSCCFASEHCSQSAMVASSTSYASRRTTDQRSNYAAQKASGYAGTKRKTMEVIGCPSPNPSIMIDSSKQRRREAMMNELSGKRMAPFPERIEFIHSEKSCFALSLYISHIKIEIADKGLRLIVCGCCRSYDPKASLGMFLVCSTVGGHTKPWSP